jgi:CheY-like chemotaxis protein
MLPRAILVEDDALVAQMTVHLLATFNYTVAREDVLENGNQVLFRLAAEPPPELIVIDVCLPGQWDGVDVLTAVRGAGVRGRAPAIVLTSGVEPSYGTIRQIREHNAVFLMKPYTMAQLKAAVGEAVAASTDWEIQTLDEDLPAASL